MIPDSVYLTLLVACILLATVLPGLDRHLEPDDDHDDDDDQDDLDDIRRDEWAEQQAIERRWETRH